MGAEQSAAAATLPAGHLPTGNLLCEGRGMAGSCVSERRAEPRDQQPAGMVVVSKPRPFQPGPAPSHGPGAAPQQSPRPWAETSGSAGCLHQEQELTVARAKAFSVGSCPVSPPRRAGTCQSSSPAGSYFEPCFSTPSAPQSVTSQQPEGGSPAPVSRPGNIVPPSSRLVDSRVTAMTLTASLRLSFSC